MPLGGDGRDRWRPIKFISVGDAVYPPGLHVRVVQNR